MLSCPIGSCDYTSGVYYSGSIRLRCASFRLLFWAILLIWMKGWWVPDNEIPAGIFYSSGILRRIFFTAPCRFLD